MVRHLWFDQLLLAEGWAKGVRLSLKEGKIEAIEREVKPEPQEERHFIGLPGLPNLHSHAFQRAIAGLTERRGDRRDSFWSWREQMYRFQAKMTPHDIEAITAMAYVEMLEQGFTRVGEFHYLHHDVQGNPYDQVAEHSLRIMEAAHQTGMGLTLLPVFYAHSGFGAQEPLAHQKRFINDLDGYFKLLDQCQAALKPHHDTRIGIAPHSLRAVSHNQLKALRTAAGHRPFHIHIAEQMAEVEACQAFYGARPVEWILDQIEINAETCLVHATHMTASETENLARSGAVAGLCPITEANLGDGIFPAAQFLAHGGAFGIGSDSNVLIDMPQELRLLEYSQRLALQERNVMAGLGQGSTGRNLYERSVLGGAQALGVVPHLQVGASADIISLRSDAVVLMDLKGDAILDSMIFAASMSLIDRVWRQGTLWVDEGRHLARDVIEARFRTVMKGLRDEL